MELTPQQVQEIAHLARLQLSPEELLAYSAQLRTIVGYVEQLAELDTTGVEPLGHALPLVNVFREDEPLQSLSVADALANAPRSRRSGNQEGGFFEVPAVLE